MYLSRYANRAKNIVCKPSINEDPNVKLIKDLRDEIFALKNLLSTENVQLKAPALKMLEDLQKKEEQEKSLTNEWTEKWRDVQKILREEKSLGLKKSGVGVTLDSEVPHLIGINDNINGVTLYSLKEGKTSIGTEDAEYPQVIIFSVDFFVIVYSFFLNALICRILCCQEWESYQNTVTFF